MMEDANIRIICLNIANDISAYDGDVNELITKAEALYAFVTGNEVFGVSN